MNIMIKHDMTKKCKRRNIEQPQCINFQNNSWTFSENHANFLLLWTMQVSTKKFLTKPDKNSEISLGVFGNLLGNWPQQILKILRKIGLLGGNDHFKSRCESDHQVLQDHHVVGICSGLVGLISSITMFIFLWPKVKVLCLWNTKVATGKRSLLGNSQTLAKV